MGPKNEHPRCGCRQCRLGASSEYGQFAHAATNRAIRRGNRVALCALVHDINAGGSAAEDFMPLRVPTPYTD